MSSANERKVSAAKAEAAAAPSTPTTPDNTGKNEKKKKSIIPRIFGMNRNGEAGSSEDLSKSDVVVDEVDRDLDKKIASISKTFSDRQDQNLDNNGDQSLELSNFELSMGPVTEIKELRVFVATWNVGGKAPNSDFNLEDFLQVEGSSDIYVLGFQEIVPLSPSNVLVIEDNEPAVKWLNLINQALNKPKHDSVYADSGQNGDVMGSKLLNNTNINLKEYYNNKPSATNPTGLHFFHKPSLKVLSRSMRADSRTLKSCNCGCEIALTETPRRIKTTIDSDHENLISPRYRSCIDEFFAVSEGTNSSDRRRKDEATGYRLVASKQMVGIFLSVWARKELIPHVAHLRVSSVGRGIMGYLGNKGCISISMTLYQTSFCFVCSHLASGEKEGDELKRNLDVAEILKSTQFPNICKNPNRHAPEKITDHDRVLWFGDLNYRVALSYEEARVLLEENDWDSLLEKDQLNIEREEKRVFDGFKEGHIFFAPTYKYSHNSDAYAGETAKSKKKRRTPAWCDRILWRGNGMEQLSYIRGESRFSDHRPVCSVLSVQVEVNVAKSISRKFSKFRNGFSGPLQLDFEHCLPQRHSFCD